MASRRGHVYMRDNGWIYPSQIIRFALFFPTTIYNSGAKRNAGILRRHPELQTMFNPLLGKGELMSAKWANIAFGWNMAMFIFSLFVPVPVNMLFIAFDAVIVAFISQVAHIQNSYTPRGNGLCKDAHNWQRPPQMNESFFEAMGRWNSTQATGTRFCKSFVEQRNYSIAIAVLLAIIVVLNTAVLILSFTHIIKTVRAEGKGTLMFFCEAALVAPRAMVIAFAVLICVIPLLLLKCLPISLKVRIRYARRYLTKVLGRVPPPTEIKLADLTPFRKPGGKSRKREYRGTDPGTPNNLSDFLGIYDMLMLVTQHLHYSDIQSLSLVSKSVREAILPSDTPISVRDLHFRMYTCSSEDDINDKRPCYVCNAQICKDCACEQTIKQTYAMWHECTCKEWCTPCYRRLLREHRPNAVADSLKCRCAPPSPGFHLFNTMIYGFKWREQKKFNHPFRDICSHCATIPADELAERRERRSNFELRRAERTYTETCGNTGCGRILDEGPRWWVCSNCRFECSAGCHLDWAEKRARNKREAV
ncbi:hypothetical protein BU24DRAFT_277346 [Aaosphaeria arxii CBS 175.79]|uniref:Uncharacterized protein n=1 Tax=Aaosphaeria arxii CBS 175.79 TaxID=1450172 RepID=A0A6A5XDY9_9PLEO|nr:uncharacterized protein BU24DRAFT_277346 [Aaosphaeria arxii CBS 175.79]KAF2011242.1 hypothetical protein BU24DRAFT_277346 [Aaosphaeria arxii CBS 175.79]